VWPESTASYQNYYKKQWVFNGECCPKVLVLMLDIMLVEVDGWIMGVTLIPQMLKNLWKC